MLRQDSAVREASADQFRRILVDEFQDTDPIQTEIVFLLTGSGNPGEPWYKRRLLPRHIGRRNERGLCQRCFGMNCDEKSEPSKWIALPP
jgi:superfamily I DNA/RNA helicase